MISSTITCVSPGERPCAGVRPHTHDRRRLPSQLPDDCGVPRPAACRPVRDARVRRGSDRAEHAREQPVSARHPHGLAILQLRTAGHTAAGPDGQLRTGLPTEGSERGGDRASGGLFVCLFVFICLFVMVTVGSPLQ